MSQTEVDTADMEEAEKEEKSCDLCKLSYSTTEALEEHKFSLMHHIKIEQRQKGSPHTCSLCYSTCNNIIDYGKHLNDDKHRKALEDIRKQKEGEEEISTGKKALLDKLNYMEKLQNVNFDENHSDENLEDKDKMEAETNTSQHPRTFIGAGRRGNFNRGHQRSYSQPNSRFRYSKDFAQSKNYSRDYENVPSSYQPMRFARQKNKVSWFDDDVNFENQHWNDDGFLFDHQPWLTQFQQQGWKNLEQPPWPQEGYQNYGQNEQPVWGGPAVENFGNSYSNFEGREHPTYIENYENADMSGYTEYGDFHGRSYRDDFHSDNRQRRREYDSYKDDEKRSRSHDRMNRSFEERRKSSPSDSSRGQGSNYSRVEDPGNLKRRRSDNERLESKSRRECDSPSDSVIKPHRDIDGDRRNLISDVSSSDKSVHPSKRYRQRPGEEKHVDEADSTTDADGLEKTLSKSSRSKSKQLDVSNSTEKKKSKHKKKKTSSDSLTDSSKRSNDKKSKDKSTDNIRTKDKSTENTSILDIAEKLCKDLRDKREKAKLEKEKKEKQKKVEKTEELNSQIKSLSNINKSYVKGVLSGDVDKLSTIDVYTVLSSSSSKNKVVSFEPVSSSKSNEQSSVIDRIRQEIEESVKMSPKKVRQGKDEAGSLVTQDSNLSGLSQTEVNERNGRECKDSPTGSSLLQRQSSDPVDKDSLLKMINSPRSRKERLYIADKLRSYAKSQNKLSLPRFNLQLSGLYDDIENTAEDLHLEELSPDVQLQIAQLIESDIKPDLSELEKALFIKNEIIDDDDQFAGTLPGYEMSSPDRHLSSFTKISPDRHYCTSTNDVTMDTVTSLSKIDSPVKGTNSVSSSSSSKIRSPVKGKKSSPIKGQKPDRLPMRSHMMKSTEDITDNNSLENKGQELTLGDLSHDKTVIKKEPVDTGYENAYSRHSVLSKSLTNDASLPLHSFIEQPTSDKPEASFGVDKTRQNNPPSLNLASLQDTRGEMTDQFATEGMPVSEVMPGRSDVSVPVTEVMSARSDYSAIDVLSGSNSEVDKMGSSHVSNISIHSSVYSLQPENLFDTVYDISLKEENLRQDIGRVDNRIGDLNKVIEEATQQLYRCQEKKRKLMQEEESLRTQRIKILKEAKDSQKSSRNSLQGSTSNIFNSLGHSQSTSNLSDGTLTNVSSLSASTLGLVRHIKPERDDENFAGSLPPSGSLKQRRHSMSETGHKQNEMEATSKQTVGDVSSSLSRIDSDVMQLHSQLGGEKPEKITKSADFDSYKRMNREQNQSTSPVGLKHRQIDRSVYSQLPAPLEPVKVTSSLNTPERKLSASINSFTNFSPPQKSNSEHPLSSVPRKLVQETNEVDKSTELKKAGFVTLNSLLKPVESESGAKLSKMLSNEASSLEEFLSGLSDSDGREDREKMVRRSKRLNPEPVVKEPEDESKKFGHVNVKFMGTLPNTIDRASFLKEIGGGKQPDKLSYMVVDSDHSQDVLSKLQSILAGGSGGIKDGKEESVTSLTTQSSVGDTKLMDLDYKSESSSGRPELPLVHHETDSNYESIASNCSLGEKIRQYCKSNKSSAGRKRKEVSVEHLDSDSDLDKTLKDEDATPVKPFKDCSVVLETLSVKDDSNILVVGESPTTSEKFLLDEDVAKSLSPSRKRLKTKKERDRKSVRKQKEEFIVHSSSEGNSVDEDEDLPKLCDLKQKLKFRTGDSPVKDLADMGLVETGSEELELRQSEILSRDSEKRRGLLDDVQLDSSVTESEDNRPNTGTSRSKEADRFKLKPDVLATFREAMKNTIKQGKELMQKNGPTELMFDGPESPVVDLQVFDQHLYVCYRCMIIREFHIKTGDLLHEYKTKPASMNCLHVTNVNSSIRLYAGGHSSVLMLFDSKSGNLLNTETFEESIQCLHGHGGRLYIGTIRGSVIVKHIKTGKITDTFKCSEKLISCLASATEGTRKVLLVASHDSVIYVCDSSTGLLLRMLEGHTKSPFCLHVDGHTVYSGSMDKVILEHHLLTGDLIWTYNQPEGVVSGVYEHKNYLFCSSYDKFIYCFDKKNHKLVKKYYGAGKSAVHKMVVTDGQIITGSREGQVEVIPVLTGNGYCCQCKGCDEVYGLKNHLLHHLLAVHIQQNTRLSRCQWTGCNDWISTENGCQEAEDHMKSHIS